MSSPNPASVPPEDTSASDPLLHMLGAMGSGGLSGYIEEQESAGQAQLVASAVLPKDGSSAYEALGIRVGDPVDDLFVNVTLPAGWKRQGSDHAMWSYVLDERGVQRVAVFYKAAFYDRKAHGSVVRPGRAAVTDVIYGDGPAALPEQWSVFTDEERADFVTEVRSAAADEYLSEERRLRARAALALAGEQS
jgi:hypothetical protein